ncbi:dTTP/UTP pyrophosphatase [Erysiphe necator]|uniref:Putative acetylserotonin methytransferase-like protein n=1 Tax=Uncinula necator TaxID=52586 RepID=A0A0B1P8V9_UNCNE|nr:dTTP/UTP pyrophosphatase [Erysiphe necator]KHJ33760.1 putative acetylserotonin methytransferase-like protein [Erysiphe necator]
MAESKDSPPSYETAASGCARRTSRKPIIRGPFPLELPILALLRTKRVILASRSPQRKQIFSLLGFKNVEIIPSTKPENLSKEDLGPFDYVLQTAMQKCLDVYTIVMSNSSVSVADPSLVIAADTIMVTTTGRILEKPRNENDHIQMLTMLRNQRIHKCFTAVVAIAPRDDARDPGYNIETTVEETQVYFSPEVSDDLIKAYVRTREGVEKAGGYGIQGMGSLLVEKIDGSVDNVIGLPLRTTLQLIERVVLDQDTSASGDDEES